MSKRREKVQKEVLALLRRHCGQLSAYDVLGELCEANPKIAPPTIYRVLADLMERGHVHRVEPLNVSIACQCDRHQHAPCIEIDAAEAHCESCGGVTTKIHVVVDANGLSISLAFAPGHQDDCLSASDLLDSVQAGGTLLADKACDSGAIRSPVFSHGAWSNTPRRRNRRDPICLSPYPYLYLYRDRTMVERFFNRLKHCRRVAAPCDKRAVNFLAFIKFAVIRIWSRVYESTSYDTALSQGAVSNRNCHPFLRRHPFPSLRKIFQFNVLILIMILICN